MVSFLLIVISGVFISKVLFRDAIQSLGIDTSVYRTIHLFFSAISLVLVGIHLGLYWGMVKGFFKKKLKVSTKVAKPVCYILLAAIVLFGAYSAPTSGFGQWLICPVVPMEHGHGGHGDKGGQEQPEGGSQQNEEADGRAPEAAAEGTEGQSERNGRPDEAEGGEQAQHSDRSGETEGGEDQAARGERAGSTEGGEQTARENRGGEGADDAVDERSGEASGAPEGTKGGERGKDGNHGNVITLPNVAMTFAQFTSIMGLFAVITYYINEALRRRKLAKRS